MAEPNAPTVDGGGVMALSLAPEAEVAPATAADAIIQLRDVGKVYGNTTIIEHLDLDVVRGEFLTLLGPSGCGKTTTLKMIAGFEEATSGRILLDGKDMVGVPPYRRPLNTVFQQYALFPHMTVFDNVAFGPRTSGMPREQVKGAVEQALTAVSMANFAPKKPDQLSGGQQQRVALARALVNHPKALLLDEPLSALDVKLRRSMQLELKRIHTDVRTTFIFVTHDQDEALTMSSRIAVMNAGRIEQLDMPETVYRRPATKFVAGLHRPRQSGTGNGRVRAWRLRHGAPRRRRGRARGGAGWTCPKSKGAARGASRAGDASAQRVGTAGGRVCRYADQLRLSGLDLPLRPRPCRRPGGRGAVATATPAG